VPWREAWESALYGSAGFYRRSAPAAHFRTSVHVSPLFARAVVALLSELDTALGQPDRLDLVDLGSGRGELLTGVAAALPPELAERVRLTGVDVVPRPAGLPDPIGWASTPPDGIVGLLIAHEWLDDVPATVVEAGPDGTVREVLVDPAGRERLGDPVAGTEADWLARWWPLGSIASSPAGSTPRDPVPADRGPSPADEDIPDWDELAEPPLRAEVGLARDTAWERAVATVHRGLAIAVDYGHTATDRPPHGSLTGFAHGREVAPIPDGSCNITAHVAVDAAAAAGEGIAGQPSARTRQRDVLHRLGISGVRPDRALASSAPVEYLRRLSAAGEAAELTDPVGLGAFWWVLQPVGIELPGVLAPH
jgi:SAM-dependent MidA family methyltransferase